MKAKIDYNPMIIAAAKAHIGTQEWPGAKSNPAVEQFWIDAGFETAQRDDVPWCAVFVGAVLASCGLPNTGKPNAKSYEQYGQPVDLQDYRPGDIVVTDPDPATWQAHVGFLVEFTGEHVKMISGNSDDRVRISNYPLKHVQAIRRADGIPHSVLPTLRPGNTAAATKIAQMQADLAMLGYFAGKIDGLYGPLTRNAVMAFQADNGLVVDGIAGPKTQTALLNAKPRPVRDVTEADLRERGSRTVKTADAAQAGTAALTVGSAITTALDKAESVTQGLDAATGLLDRLQAIALAYWPVLAILGVGAFIWFKMRDIRSFRVGDARSGANIGR